MRLCTFALVPVLALVVAGCGSKPDDHGGGGGHGEMPPPPTPVAAVLERELPVTRELTGRIEARNHVELKPRVSGVIEKVLVDDGVEVKAGDVVLEIDSAPLAAALARAEADVARAEARLAQAESQLKRGDELKAKEVIAPQQYDDLGAVVRTSAADVAAAKAARETARLELGWARVAAPIAGRIGRVATTVGNLVQADGQMPGTLITTIVAVDPIDVAFDLDEATWRTIGGALLARDGAPLPVHVGVGGEEGHPHVGHVRFVDNAIDAASGSIRLRASLPNPDRQLTPGAFARVKLQIAAPKPVVLVDERAVLAQLTTRFVLVVGADGTTAFRPVRLGEAHGALRVVEEGLAAGERIVVGGMPIAAFGQYFFPGNPVTPVATSMETMQPIEVPAGAAADAEAPAAPTGAPAPAPLVEGAP